jgi:hypothetical protein
MVAPWKSGSLLTLSRQSNNRVGIQHRGTMDPINPDEATRSGKTVAAERKYAARLLSLRDSPLTFGKLYRMQIRAQLLLLIASGIGIAYFAWLNLQPGVYLMSGALVGALLRDFGLMRVQLRLWPMQHKLLDWPKVERTAHGEEL